LPTINLAYGYEAVISIELLNYLIIISYHCNVKHYFSHGTKFGLDKQVDLRIIERENLGDRPMAGRQTLDLSIGVRIPVPQLKRVRSPWFVVKTLKPVNGGSQNLT
jgi:hypothetical protein